jgi:hypothetical protein
MLDISHSVGVTLTKESMGLIKKCKRSQLCSGGRASDELSDKKFERSVCSQHNGFPMESEFCFALYIATTTFISSKTLIKLSSSITIRRTILMHGTEVCIQMDKVTELLGNVPIFVQEFLSVT